jgi:hypothetical protein
LELKQTDKQGTSTSKSTTQYPPQFNNAPSAGVKLRWVYSNVKSLACVMGTCVANLPYRREKGLIALQQPIHTILNKSNNSLEMVGP